MNSLDVTDYLKSGTWDILDSPATIKGIPHPGTGEMKAMVIFTFRLRRKTLFYTVNLIIPCVLISFVTVCVFALPADAGEKITLCISILLALVVFLLLISKILPPSSTIPLVAKYLLFTFVMNIAAIALTVIVINRNYRTPRTHQMPYWVRVVFLNYLPRILFMERPDHMSRWQPASDDVSEMDRSQTYRSGYISSRNPDVTFSTPSHARLHDNENESTEMTDMRYGHARCGLSAPSDMQPRVTIYQDTQMLQLSSEVVKAAEALRFISRHLKNEDEYNTVFIIFIYRLRLLVWMLADKKWEFVYVLLFFFQITDLDLLCE